MNRIAVDGAAEAAGPVSPAEPGTRAALLSAERAAALAKPGPHRERTESQDRSGSQGRAESFDRTELRDQMLFLNQATARIGVSLDIESVAREFAAALVPRLADFASVHVLDVLLAGDVPDPQIPAADHAFGAPLRRIAVASSTDDPAQLGATPEGEAQIMQATGPCQQAMASGEPVLITRVDWDLAQRLATTHPTGDIAPLLVGRAMLAVPLRVRGRILGCAALIGHPDRPFDEIALLTVRQLAAQASLGVDNSRMYHGLAATAEALGRSMLPASPPTLAGVEIAHRYLPGDPAVGVGGDWYDAIPLPGSRVALVVGDVMGHGIRSASVMGHLRTAVQTLAALDLPPEQVLRHLDDLAQRLGDDHLATCIYAVYDPVARRCTIANAGHIPPVLVKRDGRSRLLKIPSGAPIGVGGVAFETAEIQTEEGDVLVLCTDGLVEVRGQDIGTGLAALCQNAAGADQPLEEVCESLLRDLSTGGDRQDDVALLIARLSGIPSGDIAQWYLQPAPTTARQVRRLIRETLAEWNLSEHSDLVELLATELVSNAIRYASRPLEFRLLRTDSLLCEVNDDDHHLPVLRHADVADEHGRGMHLVSRLSSRWGASRTNSGKVVWFELALNEPE
jgi:serine phosphatase RsbU (regulator of sigma subunit)